MNGRNRKLKKQLSISDFPSMTIAQDLIPFKSPKLTFIWYLCEKPLTLSLCDMSHNISVWKGAIFSCWSEPMSLIFNLNDQKKKKDIPTDYKSHGLIIASSQKGKTCCLVTPFHLPLI